MVRFTYDRFWKLMAKSIGGTSQWISIFHSAAYHPNYSFGPLDFYFTVPREFLCYTILVGLYVGHWVLCLPQKSSFLSRLGDFRNRCPPFLLSNLGCSFGADAHVGWLLELPFSYPNISVHNQNKKSSFCDNHTLSCSGSEAKSYFCSGLLDRLMAVPKRQKKSYHLFSSAFSTISNVLHTRISPSWQRSFPAITL